MSIERQLSEAFKRNEFSLECPPSLDNRIMAEYKQMAVVTRRGSRMKKRISLPKAAIIALVVVVLCGFGYGGKLLFSDSKGKFSFVLQSSEAVSLSPDKVESARNSLTEVKAQLAPGETAVVYLPGLFPQDNYPLAVTNLQWISDLQQWESVLYEYGETGLLPASILAGAYQFDGGALSSPFFPEIGRDTEALMNEMKEENKSANDEQILWRLTDTTNAFSSIFTTVYRNQQGEAIYVTAQVYNDEIAKVSALTSPTTAYENFEFNGKKGHYTSNDESLVGESNVLHSAMWMEEDNGTIIYSVLSDSVTMTKEKLIEAVKSLP